MNGEEAITWVDNYRCLVKSRMKEHVYSSGYEEEDYFQDAYEAALISARICTKKGISFSSVFWVVLKRTVYTNRMGRGYLSQSDRLEYLDEVYYGKVSCFPDPEERLLARETARTPVGEKMLELAYHLTLTERKVLFCISGLVMGRMSYSETATYLGTSEGAVSQTFRRIMRKAVLLRAGKSPSLSGQNRANARKSDIKRTESDAKESA